MLMLPTAKCDFILGTGNRKKKGLSKSIKGHSVVKIDNNSSLCVEIWTDLTFKYCCFSEDRKQTIWSTENIDSVVNESTISRIKEWELQLYATVALFCHTSSVSSACSLAASSSAGRKAVVELRAESGKSTNIGKERDLESRNNRDRLIVELFVARV
ncbi:hypothetical protein IRJ41_024107 [Triplophysa rosa]|uniref:Uncharacterized protein n=1 Tax=Triplophysa rosa TaxID=992332 RepID=A0A9W8CCY0_TRIRA|nr:hypothetical protein IRJ41_024107 [Triplophysa rosa]